VAFAGCAGLATAIAVRASAPWLGLAAGVASLVATVLGRRRVLALAAAFATAGLWWGSVRLEALDASVLTSAIGRTELALVDVTGPARRSEFALRVPVRVRRFGDLVVGEPARLELPRGRAPPQGAVLELVATAMRPRPAEGDGSFDEREYLRRQGVHVVLRAGWFREIGRRDGLPGLADALRSRLERTIAPGLEGERRALVAGVVLGEEEGLTAELRDRFRASGLYHLLAVSGQNVAYVVFGALLLAWLLGVPRWAGHLAALLAVGAYVAAVGWQPSVVRAGVAGSLASLAWLAARPSDRWYFLLVGAAVLLAVNPYALLEPGFQLSFAAVGAIFLLVPRLDRRLEGYPLPRRLADVVALSLACGLATAPILWLHFGAVPVFSVVANALAAPVVAPLLGIALASAALAPVLPGAALALAWANGWLAAWLAWCARAVGGLPHAEIASFHALGAVAAVAALAVVAVRLRAPRLRRAAALVGIAAALVVGWRTWTASSTDPAAPPTGLRVTFLDVGQGDAVLLEVSEGAILVDQGPPEGEAADQLAALGVRRLTAIVLTHPQRDHVGGAAEVIAELEVGSVLDPAIPSESSDEREALRTARRRGVRVVVTRAGQAYRLGRLRVRVLWPDGRAPPGDDPNNHAIVLLASYGSVDVLLTADAESNVTLPVRPPPVEVLKVAHHGSADAGLPELLARTRPRAAVISVGARNDYGHPARSTLAALAEPSNLELFRTDEDGRIVIETDGDRLSVREER
jgi:competence protein ComEC